MQNLANLENLHNFLEEKICVVLNFSKDREYFLYYTLASSGNAYHCILLDKEILSDYVDGAAEYLSHPCFLCALEEGYVLIKDWYLNWVFVGFDGKNIVDFYRLDSLEKIHEKLEFLDLDGFWLWEVGEITILEREILKELESKFTIHYIAQSLENIELLESYNFNPIEKSLPFLKTRLGVSFQCLVGGATLGFALWIILIFAGLLEQRKNAELKMQINALQTKLEALSQNRTQAHNTLISLQEKLENLQTTYKINMDFLKDFGEIDFQAVQFMLTLEPHLEKLNVKVAYFGVEQPNFLLLLVGENALKIFKTIEKESLGQIQTIKTYGEFVWGEIGR